MSRPFNLRTARWHRTRQGWEWQYWNVKVGRWSRYTREQLTSDEARKRIAQWCYGCESAQVMIEEGGEA